MKRFISVMALLFTLTFTANAMSYEQAREQALFLTDKMAYELNLTDDQYEAAYEINLDYLMSVNTVDDLYGSYWRYRNLDLSYVLLDWQYRAFCDAAYFYRPLYYSGGYWRFGVYARYPHRDYFYFNRPNVYITYVGGHSWRNNHGRSWYDGRHYGPRPGDSHFGMRDGFNRGDYGRGNRQSFGTRLPEQQHSNSSFGNRINQRQQPLQNRPSGSFGSRESSTRTTVRQPATAETPRNSFGSSRGGNSTSGSNRGINGTSGNTPRPTFTPLQRPSQSTSRPSTSFGSNRGSFGSNRGGGSQPSMPSRSSQMSSPSRSSQMSSPSRSSNSGSSNGSSPSRGSFGSRR